MHLTVSQETIQDFKGNTATWYTRAMKIWCVTTENAQITRIYWM